MLVIAKIILIVGTKLHVTIVSSTPFPHWMSCCVRAGCHLWLVAMMGLELVVVWVLRHRETQDKRWVACCSTSMLWSYKDRDRKVEVPKQYHFGNGVSHPCPFWMLLCFVGLFYPPVDHELGPSGSDAGQLRRLCFAERFFAWLRWLFIWSKTTQMQVESMWICGNFFNPSHGLLLGWPADDKTAVVKWRNDNSW